MNFLFQMPVFTFLFTRSRAVHPTGLRFRANLISFAKLRIDRMNQKASHKLTRSVVVVLLIAFSISCKKETIQYVFEGAVTESVNNAALGGVDVTVSQRVYDGNVASSFFNAAGSSTTTADGAYHVNFDREKVVEFKIELSKDGYFDQEEIIVSGEVVPEDPNIYNYTMEPMAWIRFNLVNFGGLTSDDFTMIRYNFREGCSGCTTNGYFHYYGQVDSTFTFTTTGGIYTRYSYLNPGASLYNNDSIYTTPFDTVDVNINY
jgi:hypothetical protein